MLLLNILVCFVTCAYSLDFNIFSNHTQKNVFTTKVINEEKYLTKDNGDAYYLDEHKWYIGGNRIKGDSFRYEMFDKNEFPEARDFIVEITFPKQNEFYITQVMIFAQQSTTVGKAYIIDGGIGYTYMRLIIEARRTKYFYFNLQIFGRNFT